MPEANGSIQPRHKKLGFYGVPSTGAEDVTYRRMRKFTKMTPSKNPQEYNRKYVDEPSQRTDVVGYAPQIDYGFDNHTNEPVLTDIVEITDYERFGEDAIRTLILVDIDTGFAIKRDYSVIPGSEGDDANVYNYSGTFKANGEPVYGKATSTDGWQTIEFEPDEDSPDVLAVKLPSAKVSTIKTASAVKGAE